MIFVRKRTEKRGIITFIVAAIIFLTNLSQLPQLVESGFTRYFAMPGWIFLFLFLLIFTEFNLSVKIVPVLFGGAAVFAIQFIYQNVITGYNYLGSSLTYSLFLSMFIFIIGGQCADKLDEKLERIMFGAYIFSSLIVGIIIYYNYFSGFDYLESQTYAYSSKNSISMLYVVSIALLFTTKFKSKVMKMFRPVGIVIFIFMLFITKSRACILAFFVMLITFVFSSRMNKQLRGFIIAALIIFVVLLIVSPTVYDVIINNIFLNNRDAENLNEASSGRIQIYSKFFDYFNGYKLFGRGDYYYECFYMCALLENGILCGSLVILIASSPFIYCVLKKNKNDNENLLLMVAAAYLVNGVFEGIAPFGPGVKCYFLWFMFGYVIQKKEKGPEQLYIKIKDYMIKKRTGKENNQIPTK